MSENGSVKTRAGGFCQRFANRLTPRDCFKNNTAGKEEPRILPAICRWQRKDFAIFGSTENVGVLEVLGLVVIRVDGYG